MTKSNLAHAQKMEQLLIQKTDLEHEIKRYEKYMQVLLSFTMGKRKLKYGRHANQVITYQPEDYLRLGRSLCALKRHILTLQDKLSALNGSKKR